MKYHVYIGTNGAKATEVGEEEQRCEQHQDRAVHHEMICHAKPCTHDDGNGFAVDGDRNSTPAAGSWAPSAECERYKAVLIWSVRVCN